MLPDVALLEIFEFYVINTHKIQAWHTLVHVCRKWRNVVFGSPCRLNLRLYCGPRTPVRQTLDVWPLLPVVIQVNGADTWDNGNIIAALEHNDRISELFIDSKIPSPEREEVVAALQQPFPELKHLHFASRNETGPVVPASFLGGSAPGLQVLGLDRILFPGLLNLLLSSTHLVHLSLWKIPHSGYISPEAMLTGLSVLTCLESLIMRFESPRSRPDRSIRRPPPRSRIILPVLTRLLFKGVGDYLEDLVARIDTPLLDKLTITFFHRLIFDSPQLSQFISRTPKFKAHGTASVDFSKYDVTVTLPQTFDGELELKISCRQTDWQLSSVAQVCSSSFPQVLIPNVERIYIQSESQWQDDIENNQWLELFHPFTAVTDLYLSSGLTPHLAPTLQELVGERVTEVLPALQTLFLEEPVQSGSVQEAIEQFVAARQLAGRHLAVSRWET